MVSRSVAVCSSVTAVIGTGGSATTSRISSISSCPSREHARITESDGCVPPILEMMLEEGSDHRSVIEEEGSGFHENQPLEN